jgi:hypothetical protein
MLRRAIYRLRRWPDRISRSRVSAVLEDQRIAHHLEGAERMVLARDVSHLPLATRRVRDRVIAALRDYRSAGRFPRNHVRPMPTPVFIDEHGTRCAMAHLLELVGAHELVQRVARTNNLARIRELAGDPELLQWLMVMGLTVEEAARIQPSYCHFWKWANCWCLGVPANAVATVSYLGVDDAGVPQHRIDKIHGGSGFAEGEILAKGIGGVHDQTLSPRVVSIFRTDAGMGVWGAPMDYKQETEHDCKSIAAKYPLSLAETTTAVLSPTCVDDLIAKNSVYGNNFCVLADGGPLERPDAATDTGVFDFGTNDLDSGAPDTGSADTGGNIVENAPVNDEGGCTFAHVSLGAMPVIVFSAAVLARRVTARRR